jgi:poly(A) polymerase
MLATLEDRLGAAASVTAVRGALGGGEGAWIVGGTVRDALLGRPLVDVDLAVAADPREAARAVAAEARGPLFPLSEAFGAWRVLSRDRSFTCDVSPLQAPTIEEDLARRDFTVNAMAVPVAGGALLDPEGGVRDLEAGVLRVLEAAGDAYAADPLRPLRLARLATELPLRPESRTAELTRGAAPRVTEASAERLWGELRRIVVAPRIVEGVRLADDLGLVEAVLPELHALHGVQQSTFHHLDVFDHTLEALAHLLELERSLGEVFGTSAPELAAVLEEPLGDGLTRGGGLRFATLLHDVGKPATRGVRADGRGYSFIGHDRVGAELALGACRRLRTSERLAAFTADTARRHLVLGFLVHERPLSRRAVYGYLTTCEPVEVEVTLLTCADRLATRGANAGPAIAAHLDLARELMAEALRWRRAGPPRPAVRGDELARALGIAPGPELGRILSRLQEARFTGEAPEPESALALARRVRENPGA